MKKSVVAIVISITTLVIATLTLSCAEPAPAAFKQPAAQAATWGATPEQTLEGMQLATAWSIEELITRGQSVPDYQYATLRSIEEARQALQELETQRRATQTVIDDCIMGGQTVPDFQYAVLESIEEARREVLARTGLLD